MRVSAIETYNYSTKLFSKCLKVSHRQATKPYTPTIERGELDAAIEMD